MKHPSFEEPGLKLPFDYVEQHFIYQAVFRMWVAQNEDPSDYMV
jgi:hypothetical protein